MDVAEIDEIIKEILTHAEGDWLLDKHVPAIVDTSDVRSLRPDHDATTRNGVRYFDVSALVDILLDLRLDLTEPLEVVSV